MRRSPALCRRPMRRLSLASLRAPRCCRLCAWPARALRVLHAHTCDRFRRSATEKILAAVLEEKMAFTNERDKKGRLSFVYNSDDSGETIREIVEACQQQVIGACHAWRRTN